MGGEWGDTEGDAGRDAVSQAALTVPGEDKKRERIAQGREEVGFEHGAAEMEEPRLEGGLENENQGYGSGTRQAPPQSPRHHRQGDTGEGVWQPDDDGGQRQERRQQSLRVDADRSLVITERAKKERPRNSVLIDAVVGDGPAVVAECRLVAKETWRAHL